MIRYDFSTECDVGVTTRSAGNRRYGRWFVIWFLLAVFSSGVYAKGIEIKHVASKLLDGAYVLDAEIDYKPSETIMEALEHGVPLTFEVHIEIRRKNAWLLEQDILDRRLKYVLRYHALASMYELFVPERVRPQRFATREAALNALGELQGVSLVPQANLEKGESYRLRMAVELDIESLPVPLRPRAYLSSQWSLSSEKKSWPLNR